MEKGARSMLKTHMSKNFNTLDFIRNSAIMKLKSIETYSNHILQNKNEQIDEILNRIIADEKRHLKMLLGILRTYDTTQSKKFLEINAKNLEININEIPFVSKQYNIFDNIRLEMIHELHALSNYENNISNISENDVKKKITTILDDEKTHLEELNRILNSLEKV